MVWLFLLLLKSIAIFCTYFYFIIHQYNDFKKEENYTEMTTTVNMNKVNNTWHMKDLDEQIKAVETIFSNLANSM